VNALRDNGAAPTPADGVGDEEADEAAAAAAKPFVVKAAAQRLSPIAAKTRVPATGRLSVRL
jgi:hypothetical protein